MNAQKDLTDVPKIATTPLGHTLVAAIQGTGSMPMVSGVMTSMNVQKIRTLVIKTATTMLGHTHAAVTLGGDSIQMAVDVMVREKENKKSFYFLSHSNFNSVSL